jgi:hypothetical protein
MWFRSLLVFILMLTGSIHSALWAQSKEGLERLLQTGDSLKKVSERRIEEFQKKNSVAKRFTRNDIIYLLVDINENGVPVYIKTDNSGVATTTGVNQLQSGGNLGVHFTGAGMQVGVWDGGRVRNSHTEFGGRAQPADGAAENSTHVTHVTGTILATGVNANARGMATEAQAITFDFDNDLVEMTTQSTPDQTTLLISNHSYGTLAGWEEESNGTWTWHGDPAISSTEDYKFGFYDSRTRLWDQLAFNAPYYTMVKSAGNDRTDTGDGSKPPDGPYNSIPTFGNAKNLITVGAVSKVATYSGPQSVQMSNFSSWGPTDDGRIKPDLVAPGVNVLSTSAQNDDAYAIMSGTSMATPAVTGGLTLLQQLYAQFNDGMCMRASTLKALAIHTAKEAGTSKGPDYQFGWGLLDIEAAARLILSRDEANTRIMESSLTNNQTFEIELNPIENEKITATLVWTDPPGTSPQPALNPTALMLVNDLDMTIVDEEGAEQFPWILDPMAPAAAATKGDNFRDNVEKIEFDSPLPRKYFLRIAHKGTLVNGYQNFSLILTYTSVNEPKQTFYWINGTGNWNDGTHWSLSSGGPSVNGVPSANDRVVFDGNSFSNNEAVIAFSGPQSCFSLSWFSPLSATFNMNNQTLSIYENVFILNDKLKFSSAGTFSLHGQQGEDYVFDSAQPDLGNISIRFTGEGSSWQINKDVVLDKLIMESGKVIASERHLRLSEIADGVQGAKELDISGSTIEADTEFKLLLQHQTILTTTINTTFVFSSPEQANLSLGENYLNGTIQLEDGNLRLGSSAGFRKIAGKGQVHFDDETVIDELALSSGSTIMITGGTTQTFTEKIILNSTAEDPILITNYGTGNGSISISGNHKICLDYLNVSNVDLTGEATVNAGLNSPITNSDGWLVQNCDDILFADFITDYACKDSYLFVTNRSSGNIESLAWYVNQELVSQDENPIVPLDNPAAITIELQVGDGVTTKTYSQTINLLDNTLQQNYLVLSDTRLISFRTAQRYQWLLNGVFVDGEVERSIHYTASPGEYSVLTFGNGCNRLSDPFIISSVESPTLESWQVYPNPVADFLWVSPIGKVTICFAYDMLGRRFELDFSVQNDRYRVDVRSLPAGLYSVVLANDLNVHYQATRILKVSH